MRISNGSYSRSFKDHEMERPAMVPRIIVPQEVYSLRAPYTRLPDVRFSVNDTMGIRLTDALNPRSQLDNGDAGFRQ
jgi:hypothetical protein